MRESMRGLVRSGNDGDDWAWCQSHRFAIADVLWAINEPVPSEWHYRAGAGLTIESVAADYPHCDYLAALDAAEITTDEMRDAGAVLGRYADLLRRAGRDY